MPKLSAPTCHQQVGDHGAFQDFAVCCYFPKAFANALPNRSITSEVRLSRLFCARHHSLHKMGQVPSAQGQCCPARRDKCASLRQ
jgi:hypothetical protein